MGTKQVKMEFQVVANDQASANVTITMGGKQVFSGALAQTQPVMPGQVTDDQAPYALVEFDLDVADGPDQTAPTNTKNFWTTPTAVTIAVSGGSVCLQATEANYAGYLTPVSPPTTPPTVQFVFGDADTFWQLEYATQPVWTPTAVGRLDITDNTNTGPGSLLLLDGESVSYQVAMTLYDVA
jgi:hypothetical protein